MGMTWLMGKLLPPIPNRRTQQPRLDQDNSRQEGQEAWRAIWAYSSKRAACDKRTLNAQQRRAMDAIEGAKPARKPRFVSQGRMGMSFDDKAFERAKRLAGLKGYVTNYPRTPQPR